jgi:predicted  nucleic acid-binding Zn-ribbon protein
MASMLSALLNLQGIERQLAQVKGRLRIRQKAVAIQQARIDQLRSDHNALHDQTIQRRQEADSLELDLKQRDQEVSKYRTALNSAKTNKEYAAILTQINTLKADNAKLEEEVLKIMQDVETRKAEAQQLAEQVELEDKKLQEIAAANAAEIERLEGMLADLQAKRDEAARDVPPAELKIFERIAESNDGDAMAEIEVHGKKPPHDYICGGCYMSLNAEHANALRSRDEIRTCDNCGRILYLPKEPAAR